VVSACKIDQGKYSFAMQNPGNLSNDHCDKSSSRSRVSVCQDAGGGTLIWRKALETA